MTCNDFAFASGLHLTCHQSAAKLIKYRRFQVTLGARLLGISTSRWWNRLGYPLTQQRLTRGTLHLWSVIPKDGTAIVIIVVGCACHNTAKQYDASTPFQVVFAVRDVRTCHITCASLRSRRSGALPIGSSAASERVARLSALALCRAGHARKTKRSRVRNSSKHVVYVPSITTRPL